MDRSQLVVLFGGSSDERRVSVASAQHITEVLDGPEAWWVAPDGRVCLCPADALSAHPRPFEEEFAPSLPTSWPSLEHALDDPRAKDRVFVLGFHGGDGEDGTVQAMLEARSLAFTGSGSRASRLAYNKFSARELAYARGVRVAVGGRLPVGDVARVTEALENLVKRARAGRAVAKPEAGGSSVGLFHVRGPGDVPAVAEAVARAGVQYLAEEFVEGTELTVGVVGNRRDARALPASEVRVAPGRAFDYNGKYLGIGTTELTPAQVPTAVARAAQEVAVAMHRTLGCEGYSRTDVIARDGGSLGVVCYLETNTLPGLTRASFLPQQLAAEGTSVRSFLETQIALALARRERGPSPWQDAQE